MPLQRSRLGAFVVAACWSLIVVVGCTTIDDQGRAHRTSLETLDDAETSQKGTQTSPQPIPVEQTVQSQQISQADDCVCYDTCPDDYCPKPRPCRPNLCRANYCDDYCPKPQPSRPCRAQWFYCNDYCPKCWQFGPCRPIPSATCQKGTATGYPPPCP